MKNLISKNQLITWKHSDMSTFDCHEQNDMIDDYFNCLIECDDNQQECKRICKDILN